MSIPQNGAMKPQRRFQFIDNSDVATSGHNSTQVRRHVMQEYMREKRWEARSQAETTIYEQEPQPHQYRLPKVRKMTIQQRKKDNVKSNGPTSPRNKTEVPPKKGATGPQQNDNSARATNRLRMLSESGLSNHNEYNSSLPQHLRPIPKRSHREFFLNADSFARLADMVPVLIKPKFAQNPASRSQSQLLFDILHSIRLRDRAGAYPSPSTPLSAARTDPFNALPVRLNTKDQGLFDFYATVMPSRDYGFDTHNPRALNWYHKILIPEAMKSAATFRIMVLIHAAEHEASLRGLRTMELAIYHSARAARILERHDREFPADCSETAIAATISASALANLGLCAERRQLAWRQWSAAAHKIRQHGGPAVLDQTPNLCTLINWYDYILLGYDGRGSSFCFTPESVCSTMDVRQQEDYGRKELQRQCEEFFIFLQCIEQLASVAALQAGNPIARRHQRLRYSVFAPTQPLYTLLAAENKSPHISVDVSRQMICRLAALITMNIAIWEYRYDASQSESFLEELLAKLVDNKLDKYQCVEALLQILLCIDNGHSVGQGERPWLVGRLLKVAKRLPRDSWEWLNNLLWSFLALSSCGNGLTEDWKHRIRSEISEAPLYNHNIHG